MTRRRKIIERRREREQRQREAQQPQPVDPQTPEAWAAVWREP